VDFHFHDLRHEAVSRMAPLIRDSLTLSKVTGHKSTRMLGRYFHPDASYMAGLLDGDAAPSGTIVSSQRAVSGAAPAARSDADPGATIGLAQAGVDVASLLEQLLRQFKPDGIAPTPPVGEEH
jgi:hypothetical protein